MGIGGLLNLENLRTIRHRLKNITTIVELRRCAHRLVEVVLPWWRACSNVSSSAGDVADRHEVQWHFTPFGDNHPASCRDR